MNFKNKPKAPLKIGAPWTYSEMVQFLAWAEQVGKEVMYDFTLSTALREGEVLALPWFNLNLEKGEVTVTRSVSYDEKGNPELIPKTEKVTERSPCLRHLSKSFRNTRKNKWW